MDAEECLTLVAQLREAIPHLRTSAQQQASPASGSAYEGKKIRLIALVLVTEALDLFDVAAGAACRGLPHAIYPSVRGVLERAIELAYLVKLVEEGEDGDEIALRAARDANCARLKAKRIWYAGLDLPTELTAEELKFEAQYCDKGHLRSSEAGEKGWRPSRGIEQRFRDAGLHQLYDRVYRYLSTQAHPGLMLAGDYFAGTRDDLEFSDPARSSRAAHLLVYLVMFTGLAIIHGTSLLGIPVPAEIEGVLTNLQQKIGDVPT